MDSPLPGVPPAAGLSCRPLLSCQVTTPTTSPSVRSSGFSFAPTVFWCSCDSGPTITPSPEGGAPSLPSALVHVFPAAGFATPPPASAPPPAFPAEDYCALALVSVAGLHPAVLCA